MSDDIYDRCSEGVGEEGVSRGRNDCHHDDGGEQNKSKKQGFIQHNEFKLIDQSKYVVNKCEKSDEKGY